MRKDGRVIWMSVRSSPVRDTDGRLLYLVRVVQDVTERKAAEQRAETADRRIESPREEHARHRAVARLAERARRAHAGGVP